MRTESESYTFVHHRSHAKLKRFARYADNVRRRFCAAAGVIVNILLARTRPSAGGVALSNIK